MAGKKKFESGTHKRKVVREKESREKELLRSIPKLTGFFKRPAADDGGPTKCSVSHSPEAADEAGLAQVEVTGEEKRRGAEDEEEVEEEEMEEEGHSIIGGGGDESGPYSSDPGRWGSKIDRQARAYWAKMGPEACQNKSADLCASERIYKHQRRFFSKTYFICKLSHGECVSREWLCYSPSVGSVFCFACKMFGESKEKSAFLSGGYSDWKHAGDCGRLLILKKNDDMFRYQSVLSCGTQH